jgi:hypothetical protein
MKKIFAVVVLAVMLAILPTFALNTNAAAGGNIPDSDLTWELEVNHAQFVGILSIRGTGAIPDLEMDEYYRQLFRVVFHQPWLDYRRFITNIVIYPGVTAIGDGAFATFPIASVVIPDGITSIGDFAFWSNGLSSVVIPDSVTTIGESAFGGGSHLTSVTIPDGVTTIGRSAFAQNRNLTSVTIGNNVKTIGSSAFANNNLTSVTIGNNVTTIGDLAFRDNNLTSIRFTSATPPTVGTSAFANRYSVSGRARAIVPESWAEYDFYEGKIWHGLVVSFTLFEVPPTGVPSVTGAMAAMFSLFAASTVLWGVVLRKRKLNRI